MRIGCVTLFVVLTLSAQTRSRPADYALVLDDPPAAQMAHSGIAHPGITQSHWDPQGAEARSQLRKIASAQTIVLAELARRKVRVVAASQILGNASFVHTTLETALQLKTIPGLPCARDLPQLPRALNAAMTLTTVSTA